jgi:hypothetical protein
MYCQRIADSCSCEFDVHRYSSRKTDASHFSAVRTALVLSLVGVFALLANSAPAQSYNEIASTWFLNPVTSNWTCSIAPGLPPVKSGTGAGACMAASPIDYGFAGVKMVPVTKLINGSLVNRTYFYTQIWGEVAGPGSECGGDTIGLFETGTDHDSLRGSGLIYRGTVRPCDGQYYGISSAFKDPNTGYIDVVSGVTNVNVQNDFGKRIVYGASVPNGSGDNGETFPSTWPLLVRVDNNSLPTISVTDMIVAPHPHMANVWFGFMSFFPYSPYYFATTPVMINWNNSTFSYLTAPNTWTTIPVGGSISVMPYSQIFTRATNLVYVPGNARWELWVDGMPGNEIPPRSGVPPCGFPAKPSPTADYNWNLGNSQGQLATGASASFYIVNSVASSYFATTGPYPLHSYGPNGVQDYGTPTSDDIRPNPSDYSMAFGIPSRADLPDGTWALYTGSLDAVICNYQMLVSNSSTMYNDAWSGSGILFTRVVNQ